MSQGLQLQQFPRRAGRVGPGLKQSGINDIRNRRSTANLGDNLQETLGQTLFPLTP